jgi:aminoglycoside 2''-phosphotransferase
MNIRESPMDESFEKYLPRVRELLPGIDIQSIIHNAEGLVNDVFIVNGNTVVRFAKDEYAIKALQAELQIFDLVRPHIRLAIPSPTYRGEDVVVYRLLEGETFSKRLLISLSEQDQQATADQLAGFLKALHAIPVREGMPTTLAPVTHERWLDIRQKVEQKIYPLLLKHQIEWVCDLFDDILCEPSNFAYQPCLIHGDLGPYHILFDRKSRRLSGILDFGVSGTGDPATDVGNLLQVYGESFVNRLRGEYPQIERLMKRARFYAQALELQWVLSGLTSGEAFWFTAHIGGARDVLA